MMDVAAITTAISGVTSALALTKELATTESALEKAEMKMKLAEVTSALADAKMALSEAKTEIADLNGRIVALQSGETCPLCNEGNMKVTASQPHQHFGTFGVQMQTLTCTASACSHSEKRMYDPRKVTKS